MALPNWLLPAGLAAGVVAALAFVRKPSIQPNDVVAVRREVLFARLQLPEAVLNLIPATVQKLAIRVSSEQNGLINGQVQGWIDPTSNVPTAPIAGPPVQGLPRSAVTDHYRGNKRIG